MANAWGNDDFGGAEVVFPVLSFQGFVASSWSFVMTSGSTLESGEPANSLGADGGRSVWYAWNGPSSVAFRINDPNYHRHFSLEIFQGSSLADLTLLAGSLDTLSFVGSPKTQYYLRVDDFAANAPSQQFEVTLFWTTAAVPRGSGANFAPKAPQTVA